MPWSGMFPLGITSAAIGISEGLLHLAMDYQSDRINAQGTAPSMFEPVHGSAPDIAGTGTAHPVAAILAGAMMLDHLGHEELGARITGAVRRDLEAHGTEVRSTQRVGDDITTALRAPVRS